MPRRHVGGAQLCLGGMLSATDGRPPRPTDCAIAGAGVIGPHVADTLARSGRDVRICGRDCRGAA